MRRFGLRRRPRAVNPVQQHFLEAQALHQKYGGAFDLVQAQFLGLDEARLSILLDLYGKAYGKGARQYALGAITRWRSGKVTMAGQTMTRVFDLLPCVLADEEKLELIKTLRRQTLARLHRQQVRLTIHDRRDLLHVAQQVMGMVASIDEIEMPPDFVEVQGWINRGDAQALSGMARDTERFLAVQRLSDLLTQLGTVSRLRTLAGRGFRIRVQTRFEIPTASVDITFGKGFWKEEQEPMAEEPGEKERAEESDQNFLVRLQELALREERQDGSMTYIEYVMRTLTPQEQQRLRALAATEGLRTEVLLQELRVKTLAARGDIDATIATAERLKQTGQNSKITSEHATASGTTKIEIENKKRPCYIATACYGNAAHPDVVLLREFRDNTLRRFLAGRLFIAAYELFSPPLAARLGASPQVSRIIRQRLLEPLTRKIDAFYSNYSNSASTKR